MSSNASPIKARFPHLVAVILLALVPAACGDDGGTTAGETASGDPARFCDALVETYTTMNRTFAGIDFETTSEDELGQILADLRQDVRPLYDEIELNAPERLAGVVERRLEVGRQALETGEEDLSAEAQEDERVLDEFAIAECDVESHDVTLTEYAFTGLPGQIESGVTAFELRNEGTEHHEIGFYLVPDGTAESGAQLVADEPAIRSLERVGGSDLQPGDGFATFIDLEAGRYVVACLLPVDDSVEDSDTHAARGMFADIVVE